MKFLFHTHLSLDFPERLAEFAVEYPDHDFISVIGKEKLFTEIADTDVLIDHRISPLLLERSKRLKWLFIPFTGVDRIPWELLRERSIRVSNNHGNSAIVAERAFALALAVMGRIPEFDNGLRKGIWHRNDSRDQPFVFWNSLAGINISILGTGAIACHIARMTAPFTDRITGFRRRENEHSPECFQRITTNLRTALETCDLCFITLPLTRDTRGLIGEDELELLNGAFLVNVSRGEIVQEKPLFDALKEGRLAGAGLDAWYRYPEPFHSDCLPSNLAFHELDNVVLSPHAGSHALAGKLGQLEGTLKNIASLIEKGEPLDIVDPAAGY